MKGKYTAKQVAEFMVNYAYSKGEPISNLQLQKYLYYLWIRYYRENREYLFSDTFGAWQFGPVIPEIYYKFCIYGSNPIRKSFEICMDSKKDENFIKKFVDDCEDISIYELIEMAHHSEGAWDLVFNNCGNHEMIGYDLIIQQECDSKDPWTPRI